jgi:hypothetical protein
MDFKSLINKISSLNDEVKAVAAPELPQAVQLNEDAQLRVLSGRSTYVAEAKKKAEEKKEEKVDEEMKVGDKKASSTGGTIEKTKTGIKHTAGKNYGGDKAPKDDEDDAPKSKKKAAKESIDTEAFKGKFAKMVEAEMKTGEKKPSSTGGTIEKTKTGLKHTAGQNYSGKTAVKDVKEGAKPDFLDIDGDGDKKEPMKKAAGEKGGDKKDGKKGMSDKQAKYFGKKNESVSPDVKKKAKKVVAESVETKLSFKQMVQLVQESGGQQQIDPTDKELFNWATRVAASKLGEGMKAELYAGLIYERNGGVFEMYDVLSEDQK